MTYAYRDTSLDRPHSKAFEYRAATIHNRSKPMAEKRAKLKYGRLDRSAVSSKYLCHADPHQLLTKGSKFCVMLMTTGPNSTVINAGKTQKIKGINNLMGNLAAASSAINRRLVLRASEWTSNDSPMLVPNRSA
jgi:type IV secretory pathway VirB4 component